MQVTTVGYGDISPTNTLELGYTLALLWVSLIVFSASIGILMNLITGIYEEGQERRNKLADLAKYMSWRMLPREMRLSLRRYLNFMWDTSLRIGEVEVQVMEKLSPTLRSKLCVYLSLGYTGTGGACIGVPVHLHRYTATNFIPVSLRYA